MEISKCAAVLFLAPTCLVVACGATPTRVLHPGRVDGLPSMEALPDLPVAETESSQSMQFGLRLARESFQVPPPDAPHERTALALTDWAEGVLLPWLQQKTLALEASRHELDIAAEERHEYRVTAGAIVGLMYEDIARVLSAVPAPTDLDSEPDILVIYRANVEGEARPFLETARRAYRACAMNAAPLSALRVYTDFCNGRLAALPTPDARDGETVVEMVPE